MGFEFTSSAQCDYCGNHLASSDEDCTAHTRDDLSYHVFRHVNEDDTMKVQSIPEYKWNKLHDEIADEWIEWVYIGSQEMVDNYNKYGYSIREIPSLQVCTDSRRYDEIIAE
jgi:hypothetical protein